jgi:hypothetical protein
MQRRKFILLTTAGGVTLSLSGLSCNTRRPAFYPILDKPRQLAYICDKKTIQEIGRAYQVHTPAETAADQLIRILSADSSGRPISSSADVLYVQQMIDQKITQDFEKGNTVVVKGWILAVTEARQCALFAVDNT